VLNGFRYGLAALDGIAAGELGMEWDRSRFLFAPVARRTLGLDLRVAVPVTDDVLPENWEDVDTYEGRVTFGVRTPGDSPFAFEASLAGGIARSEIGDESRSIGYPRLEIAAHHIRRTAGGRATTFLRAYGGFADRAPEQRRMYVSAADPFATFANHWWRPNGAILDQDGVNYIPLGGGGLRGYSPYLSAERLVAANIEQAFRLFTLAPRQPRLGVWLSAFADGGHASGRESDSGEWLADAGLGLSLRGFLYDRDVRLRVDFPVYVNHPELAHDDGSDERVGFRWGFSFADLW